MHHMLFLTVNGKLMRQQLPNATTSHSAHTQPPSLPSPLRVRTSSASAAGLVIVTACVRMQSGHLALGAEQTLTQMSPLCSQIISYKWIFPAASQGLRGTCQGQCAKIEREREKPAELTASACSVWFFWLSFLASSFENTVCSSTNAQTLHLERQLQQELLVEQECSINFTAVAVTVVVTKLVQELT